MGHGAGITALHSLRKNMIVSSPEDHNTYSTISLLSTETGQGMMFLLEPFKF